MAKISRHQALFPFLRYKDATAAIEWLSEAFGFEIDMVVPGETDGSIAHAQMRHRGSIVMLGSFQDDDLGLRAPTDLGGVNQGIYVVIDDAEAHYATAKAAGAEIVMELTRTDYGSHDYSAKDPEGNLWSFGTYHPADDDEG